MPPFLHASLHLHALILTINMPHLNVPHINVLCLHLCMPLYIYMPTY